MGVLVWLVEVGLLTVLPIAVAVSGFANGSGTLLSLVLIFSVEVFGAVSIFAPFAGLATVPSDGRFRVSAGLTTAFVIAAVGAVVATPAVAGWRDFCDLVMWGRGEDPDVLFLPDPRRLPPLRPLPRFAKFPAGGVTFAAAAGVGMALLLSVSAVLEMAGVVAAVAGLWTTEEVAGLWTAEAVPGLVGVLVVGIAGFATIPLTGFDVGAGIVGFDWGLGLVMPTPPEGLLCGWRMGVLGGPREGGGLTAPRACG